jgi:kynurenine formamidase
MNLQAASQLDGLAHVGYEDCLYNGFWAGNVTSSSGARRLGVHHCMSRMIGRGVLLDVAGHENVRVHDGEITPELLDEVITAQGLTIEPGDLLLFRTGLLGAWYQDLDDEIFRQQGGLTTASIPWLAEHDIAFVGADNRAVEAIPGPPNSPRVPFHIAALRDLGMPLGEIFYLEDLAKSCASDGVYEFMFVAEPLPIVNAAGAPLNPVAIK